MRHNLNTIINKQAQRAIVQKVVRAGAADFSTSLQKTVTEKLNTTSGGTAYPVFVAGFHNPDDTTERWIP